MEPHSKLRVPRGLWKGRANKQRGSNLASNHRPAKRHRFDSEETTEDGDTEEVFYVVECSPEPEDEPEMENEPVVAPDSEKVEEWNDLKELFFRATQMYDNDDISEALPLLRGVIHECHRLLLLYTDPSCLYNGLPRRTPSPEPISISPSAKPAKKCTCAESPTAFHALLGTALFLFGNLISQDSSLAVDDEPTHPATYWLAALDVFETGENLPSRTSGRGCVAPEDWRMAIVWGRTLLAVADEALSLSQGRKTAPPPPEPKWPSPAASPFAAIALRRPPACRRITLSASPHDLLLLAMDQFTRGIFHMPHPAHASEEAPVETSRPFSRATELFTIAREVLALAERLPTASERLRWATWADGILQQMDMEGDTNREQWRGPVTRARGECWLVVGTARMEDIEAIAEDRGWDEEVLDSEDAEEAREGLNRAIEYFERAAGSAKGEFGDEVEDMPDEQQQMHAFLAEALLTLANLTKDETKREELYQRAQTLGGESFLEGMDVDD
ncbi:hypothetical protein MIND_00711200 [Mycena indigotica]|uniref:Uncharacterized protein n=1 Tax=Mycena indigotica TaxID=2126181 RepID=A0A8H6SLC9_9AGAR|nr:uncharacterized protein MIND_00711200 [Mycena indigotica]KAF7301459.1 hypothetical protein MIND_00711200 [Mycena indigotica]